MKCDARVSKCELPEQPNTGITRRSFLHKSVFLSGLAAASGTWEAVAGLPGEPIDRVGGPRIKVSCNAYSFNRSLRNGEMSLDELLEFCARLDFDAVDLTGYYFPNFPSKPPRDYVSHIKRRAYLLGLEISGTGVRNDFTQPEPEKRSADVDHIKEWIEVARDLGAPVLRIFAGRALPEGQDRSKVSGWVVESIQECCQAAAAAGVMLALQNHAGFIQTPDHLIDILERVDSGWLAVNLDIGSFRSEDPYAEIARAAPYSVTWQIKQFVHPRDESVSTDLSRIVDILRRVDFRGYILVETLGEVNPTTEVPKFLGQVRRALAGA